MLHKMHIECLVNDIQMLIEYSNSQVDLCEQI